MSRICFNVCKKANANTRQLYTGNTIPGVYHTARWMSSSLYNVPGAQFAAIVYDDNVKQCGRCLVNTLEIYENLFQHGVHVDIANCTRHRVHYIWKNTTSSTKPEVHNVLNCRQKRIESFTAEDNMYRKFRELWACSIWDTQGGHTYRQTDRHAHRNTSNPYRQRNKKTMFSIVIRSMLN